MRGEYAFDIETTRITQGSPPLARGILKADPQELVITGITPACAGNTELDALTESGYGDHPRLRGEYPQFAHIC